MVLFALCLAVSAHGEEGAKQSEPVGVMKEVTGTVSAIDNHCIAVVYKHDAATGDYELPITIEDSPQMEHVEFLNQIKAGDTVTVKYEQMTEMGADGKEIIGDKFAKTIIFLRSPPYRPPEKEEAEEPLDSEQDR